MNKKCGNVAPCPKCDDTFRVFIRSKIDYLGNTYYIGMIECGNHLCADFLKSIQLKQRGDNR